MRDELLAYLLNDLDDEQRSRIEARLESDPIWRHEFERLREYMEEARDSSNCEADTPPEDLVQRTCLFVKQASAQGALSPTVLPASLTESQEIAAPKNRRWTLLDISVVACLLLVMGSLLLPALRKSRDAARRQQCQENLHRLGFALAKFAEQAGGQIPVIDRHENAGMYALKLVESGILTRRQLIEFLVCPSTQMAEDIHRGVVVFRIPTRQELSETKGATLKSLLENMGGSFAYRIGYVDQHGNYCQVEFSQRCNAPVMADKPSSSVVGFQSANHSGCGQNVMFQDQSVRYVQLCIQTDRDKHWFLNEDNQPAAGKHKQDIVMMRSEARPFGFLTVKRKK
ncbi:MAG: DUF1559 domain-containing protein [Planctomycetes bacterium]|nr:DUF1559 domain-containing protein [Planctomycetota bacterium]